MIRQRVLTFIVHRPSSVKAACGTIYEYAESFIELRAFLESEVSDIHAWLARLHLENLRQRENGYSRLTVFGLVDGKLPEQSNDAVDVQGRIALAAWDAELAFNTEVELARVEQQIRDDRAKELQAAADMEKIRKLAAKYGPEALAQAGITIKLRTV